MLGFIDLFSRFRVILRFAWTFARLAHGLAGDQDVSDDIARLNQVEIGLVLIVIILQVGIGDGNF